MQKDPYFDYLPNFIDSNLFSPIFIQVAEKCYSGLNGSRLSCIYDDLISNDNDEEYIYNTGKLPRYDWKEAPKELISIKEKLENHTGQKFDYVLFHIYASGFSSISYHSDFEALNSTVVSVSLGATRKFRFKKIGRKRGWDHELLLKSGDVVIMHPPREGRKGCQEVYLHTVPKELKVKNARINLTFRQY